MIEEKLLEKGISKKDLDSFATRPLHNAKKDVFRYFANLGRDPKIISFTSWGESENFYPILFEVLREEGVENLGYEKSFAAQKLSIEMLGTLNIPRKYGQYEKVGLDQVYQDTIERLEKNGE